MAAFQPIDIIPFSLSIPRHSLSNKELAVAWVKNSCGIHKKLLEDDMKFLLEIDYPGTWTEFHKYQKKASTEITGGNCWELSEQRLLQTLRDTVAWVKRHDPEVMKKEEEKKIAEEAAAKAKKEAELLAAVEQKARILLQKEKEEAERIERIARERIREAEEAEKAKKEAERIEALVQAKVKELLAGDAEKAQQVAAANNTIQNGEAAEAWMREQNAKLQAEMEHIRNIERDTQIRLEARKKIRAMGALIKKNKN
jgi:hypothetical protein